MRGSNAVAYEQMQKTIVNKTRQKHLASFTNMPANNIDVHHGCANAENFLRQIESIKMKNNNKKCEDNNSRNYPKGIYTYIQKQFQVLFHFLILDFRAK